MNETILKPLANILIIEDDSDILEIERYHLENEGFSVHAFTSTKDVEEALAHKSIDLLIVDRMLPGIDGSDFVRYLRGKGQQIPVIFVTAKAKEREIEEGFSCGGDDYLCKPFNPKELVCRVKAILKRTCGATFERLEHRDMVVLLDERRLFIDKKEVFLTKLEFDLLCYMIRHKQRIMRREELVKEIWKEYKEVQKRTVNVTVNRLRKKIDPQNTKHYIVPVHGIGYKLL